MALMVLSHMDFVPFVTLRSPGAIPGGPAGDPPENR